MYASVMSCRHMTSAFRINEILALLLKMSGHFVDITCFLEERLAKSVTMFELVSV